MKQCTYTHLEVGGQGQPLKARFRICGQSNLIVAGSIGLGLGVSKLDFVFEEDGEAVKVAIRSGGSLVVSI
jgi:hypothetical protein